MRPDDCATPTSNGPLQQIKPDWVTRGLQCLPPEMAHNLALGGLSKLASFIPPVSLPAGGALASTCMGLRFRHPVCLAAGFDKKAQATHGLNRFGFAGMEVGSITPHAQAGNPQPRLFRLPKQRALINRMGFNSDGMDLAAQYLAQRNQDFIVGVNFGLNKGVDNYELQFRDLTCALAQDADYITINLSSPNTPGLRNLLDPQHIETILHAVRGGLSSLGLTRPIVLKLSPDMDAVQEAELLAELARTNIDGVIVSNTTITRDMLPATAAARHQIGGLSGAPLAPTASAFLDRVVAALPTRVAVIASGGIGSGQDIYDRLRAGAHLVQIYTAFVYGGRQTVPTLLAQLQEYMMRDGVASVQDITRKARRWLI